MTERINKKAFKASILTHVLVVIVLVGLPVLRRCSNPPKPPDVITFVDLVGDGGGSPSIPANLGAPEPPQPEPEPEPPQPEPEPVLVPEPEPIPIKEPVKEPIPTPIKEVPKKHEIKVNTNKVVRKDVPKPKPATPAAPKLSEAELRKLLSSGLPTSSSASAGPIGNGGVGSGGGSGSELGRYYGNIKSIFDRSWNKPAGTSGSKTTVSIRIAKNGAILNSSLLRPSGNQALDDSVMQAVRSVSTLPPLPANIRDAFIDVSIEFELTGSSM